jgi:uncharacterized protein (TIGR02145 family)
MTIFRQTIFLFAAIIIAASSFAQEIRNCGTVKDIDGNEYQTVIMGDECWMRENLRTLHYADGREIQPMPQAPNNDPQNINRYGRLYTWHSVLDKSEPTEETDGRVQGPCPDGWHVPANFEWMGVEDFVGYKDYYRCGTDVNNVAKAMASTEGWQYDFMTQGASCCIIENVSTNNGTGFCVLPAGNYWNGMADGFGKESGFWTCSDGSPDTSPIHRFYYTNATVEINCTPKEAFYSVRCLKNK